MMKPLARRFKNCLPMAFVAVMLLSFMLTGIGTAAPTSGYVPNEYIIHVLPGSALADVKQQVDKMGAYVVSGLPLSDTYLIRLGHANTSASYSSTQISSSSKWLIDKMQPNLLYTIMDAGITADPTPVAPNDRDWGRQWDMEMIHMPLAWAVGPLLPGINDGYVVVAVNDTGVGMHPELTSCLVDGVDVHELAYSTDTFQDVIDPNFDAVGHGTHVAGTIAAQGNNDPDPKIKSYTGNISGVCGINYDNVKILPIRVLSPYGTASTATIVAGLDEALKYYNKISDSTNTTKPPVYNPNFKGMVVNMSYGGPAGVPDDAEHQKMLALAAKNIILVAASGNHYTGDPYYVGAPAMYDECIAVGSVGHNEDIAYYSNYGPGNEVDIVAPGGDWAYQDYGIWSTCVSYDESIDATTGILTIKPNYFCTYEQGTSMAAPHVSGAAALLMSYGVPPKDVRARLMRSARRPVSGVMNSMQFGAGILNVYGALTVPPGVKITSPMPGATVTTTPSFTVSLGNVDKTTVKVFIGDMTADNKIPDATTIRATTPVIDWSTMDPLDPSKHFIDKHLSADGNTLTFASPSKLSEKRHYIFVQADTLPATAFVSDCIAFTASQLHFSAGLYYMFAFPFLNVDAKGLPSLIPENILCDADVDANGKHQPLSKSDINLYRWVAIPGVSGYSSYANDFQSLTWGSQMFLYTPPAGGDPYYLPSGGGYYSFTNVPIPPGTDTSGHCTPAGSGYWLKLTKPAVISDTYTAFDNTTDPLVDPSKGYSIRLYTGWNMIGNPYNKSVPWQSISFKYRGETKSYQDAVDSKWIGSAIYGYKNYATTLGDDQSGYVAVGRDGNLEPFSAYWIKALVGSADATTDTLMLKIMP